LTYPNGSPQRLHNYCAANDTQKGDEWDWLTFLWETHNKTANLLSLGDLQNVYRLACTGSTATKCANGTVFYDEPGGSSTLKAAAISSLTIGQSAYFDTMGHKLGVNVLP
jgi:hypothetical protein